MPYRYLILCILFLAFGQGQLLATYHFTLSPDLRRAYDRALSLRFAEAEAQLAQIKKNEPDNALVYYVENYIDVLKVFINEDKAEFERLEKNKDKRLAIFGEGDKNSPYYLYTQAELRLHWAMARAKFGEYVTALREVKKAYNLLEENQKKFPDFVANKRSLGVLHAAVGNIPPNYKWGVELLTGMDGTIEQGLREVREVMRHAKANDYIFENETLVTYAMLVLHVGNDQGEAWSLIASKKADAKSNPLLTYAYASIAMQTGRGNEAISILEARPKGKEYHPFLFLDYLLGEAKLYRLDRDADTYLLRYATQFKGMNYIKQCYQKLAWHALIHGDLSAYKSYMFKCKTKGYRNISADKKAHKDAQSSSIPDVRLLRARLLFDGGYYDKALGELQRYKEKDFAEAEAKLEYNYRMGRIYHRMGKSYEALNYYGYAINDGQRYTFYYACNAALQSGFIYEEMGNWRKAREYYDLCLSIRSDEYEAELHAKAKTGLNRIKGK